MLRGFLFDGARAVAVPIQMESDGAEIMLAGAAETRRLAHDQVTADVPVPGVRRLLRLSDGSLIETDDGATVDALWPPRSGIARIAFMLESRWWATLAGLGFAGVLVWITVAYLLPLAAQPVSRLISPQFERIIGLQSLAALDRLVFKPSELSAQVQKALSSNFDRCVAGETEPAHTQLEFRKAGVANAFALPGDIIVVTDEMVDAINSPYEFCAVIAHEVGHLRGHHATRMALQDSGLAVLMTALAGDAVGTTILAAAMPSILLRARYSRQFETEADEYAFELLKRRDISPRVLADMLRRLQMDKSESPQNGTPQYLSNHPATEDRIRRAESYPSP